MRVQAARLHDAPSTCLTVPPPVQEALCASYVALLWHSPWRSAAPAERPPVCGCVPPGQGGTPPMGISVRSRTSVIFLNDKCNCLCFF